MPVLITEVRMLALVSPVLGVVTRAFSNVPVVHPVTKAKIVHRGTDFAAPLGRDVRALADGVVVATAKRAPGDTSTNGVLAGRTGSCVLVDHGAGLRSYYGHTAPHVPPGQRVTAGQVIGRSDGSGNITGPHLHLEVHVNGIAVDVEPWAEQRGLDIGITDTNAPPEDDVALTDKQAKALDWLADNLADLDTEQSQVKQIWAWMGGGSAATEFYRIKAALAAQAGQIAGLSDALKQAAGGAVDLAAVQEAARKGAAAAIDSIEVKVVGA